MPSPVRFLRERCKRDIGKKEKLHSRFAGFTKYRISVLPSDGLHIGQICCQSRENRKHTAEKSDALLQRDTGAKSPRCGGYGRVFIAGGPREADRLLPPLHTALGTEKSQILPMVPAISGEGEARLRAESSDAKAHA